MADRIVVMNHGVIEQVGTPDRGLPPARDGMFVADFIGTMNLHRRGRSADGAVPGNGGIRAGGLALACDASEYAGGDRVTAAIRPEDITLVDAGSAGEAGDTMADGNADADGGFDATVEYVEFLGSFARVGLGVAGERLLMDLPIAQVQRFEVTEGSTVRAVVPADAVRIYAGRRPMAEGVPALSVRPMAGAISDALRARGSAVFRADQRRESSAFAARGTARVRGGAHGNG